ncbi:UNKNOWN [Stylonychia lemnae]|uniref:tRNA (GuanineN(7))methyltransferase n=1 Tax=Stylonychia lemnae TaxID=5949 RepID=A0A078AXA2_STYLE|nr:UNKNOWN [Stylonychia lemnae]|eukprot:CDW86701.1 UNKNOWN [Stylonychia lemnae]
MSETKDTLIGQKSLKSETTHQPKILDLEQIKLARVIIKENHPLNNTHISQVFPVLKPCTYCCGSQSKGDEKQSLLDDENKYYEAQQNKLNHAMRQATMRKSKKEVSKDLKKQDPFNFLGFGMVAYRDLMLILFMLFTLLSLLMFPAMYYYSKSDGYGGYQKGYDQYSLGNMGYSNINCQTVPFEVKKINMFCQFGTITKIKSIGINPSTIKSRDVCANIQENKVCTDIISKEFDDKIRLQVEKVQKTDFETTYTLKDVFVNYGTIKNDPKTKVCADSGAMLYIQYTCEQSDEELKEKYSQVSIISCFSIFAACIYAITIYFVKKYSKLNQIDWDLKTVTPGDYTLRYEISTEAYMWFCHNIYDQQHMQEKGIPKAKALKDYMKSELETILTNMLNQMKLSSADTSNIRISQVKIADIVFSYNNGEFINLLKQRGMHIQNQRFEQMRDTEKKICELKNQKFTDLTRPVEAFITFEEEDGSIIGQEFKPQFNFFGIRKSQDQKFLGQALYLIETTEPTNIIWENRHYTKFDIVWRSAVVLLAISFLVLISFTLIFICKSYSNVAKTKYPDIDCPTINITYGQNLAEYAYKEYDNYYNFAEKGFIEPTPLSGALQCYCDTYGLGISGYKMMDFKYNNVKICKQYYMDGYLSFAATNAAQYMIIAINFILRLFIIKLIVFIGRDTESAQTKLITNGVFIVQFFNTALLLLLVNANFNEQFPMLSLIFKGNVPDFNEFWFQDIGNTLVGAMLFNIYWPVLEFFVWYGYRTLFRCLDRGLCKCDSNKTKKITIQQYVEIYSGPNFFIHYKYSSILNITFVTMMYGVGLPILFPIAALSFLTLYLVEKTMVYYSYRQPPMYDEKLNINVLTILTYAPILFLGFGYWMLSSKQLLSNELFSFTYDQDIKETGHIWYNVLKWQSYVASPSLPMLLMFWVFLIGTVTRYQWYKLLCTLFPNTIKVGDLEIDEDLDNYFNTLDDHDRNWSIKEEEYSRSALGMEILHEQTLTKLRTSERGDSTIQGVHCYDILANPLYLDDFQYFSPSMEERQKYIIDDDDDEGNDTAQSDLVKVILNLAFLTEKQAVEFTFTKDAYKQQKMNAKPSFIN